jgi:hypothetical protein
MLVISSLAYSFCGCLDIDGLMIDLGFYDEQKDVNAKHNVILRENKGYVCKDENNQIAVWDGDAAIFHVQIKDGYRYLGNSANADFDARSGTLKIDHVKAPTTIDVYVGDKYDLYCVDIKAPEDAEVAFLGGYNGWSEQPGEVTVTVSFDKRMFSFGGWVVHTDGAQIEIGASSADEETFTFKTVEKGVVKLEAILLPAD